MIPRKLVQALLLLLFVSVVSVSTFVLLQRQLAPLLQDLDSATPAPGGVTATTSSQSITPTPTAPPLTLVLVAATEPAAVTPASRSPALAPPTPNQMGIVNSPVVNVRSAPSLAGEVLGQVKQGDRLEILATSPDGQWLQVCCPLGSGEGIRPSWVAAELIAIQP